ncbi:MAG: DUF4372 domain-containing protein, partial [Bacteroidales bacterium]|nr:DUF4372 domain-containing protein [Bacteroidales bacterium]
MVIFVVTTKTKSTLGKSTNFIGQPLLNQLLFFVSGVNIRKISKRHNAERYVKKFDTRRHMTVMLFGVLEGYHSIRELVTGMLSNAHKLSFWGCTVWFVTARCPMPTNGARVPYLGTSIWKYTAV